MDKRTRTEFSDIDDAFFYSLVEHSDAVTIWSFSLTCKRFRKLLRSASNLSFEHCYPHALLMGFALSCGYEPTERSMQQIAEVCDVDTFEMAHTKLSVPIDSAMHVAAIKGKNRPMIEHFNMTGTVPRNDDALCNEAAKQGDLSTLMYLRQKRYHWSLHTAHNAAMFGHWELLRWIHSQGGPIPVQIINLIAMTEDVELIEWAIDAIPIAHHDELLRCVIQSKNIEAIDLCRRRGCPWSEGCFGLLVCATTDDEYLVRAIAEGCPLDESCDQVARSGDFDALQMVHRRFLIPLQQGDVCSIGASFGNMEMISWARTNGPLR